jgi:hypothetical protein
LRGAWEREVGADLQHRVLVGVHGTPHIRNQLREKEE